MAFGETGFEYQFWTVAQLQQIGLSPEFATSFNYFVRDVANINANGEGLEGQVIQNTADISTNATNIGGLQNAVASNSSRIDAVETLSGDNETAISDHVALTSAHGVSGSNVGTGDYCTPLVGGVVNLASLVADLTEITTADLLPAPAAYDQTYAQLAADLTNENKAKINEISLKINELILGQITAKQMSAT